MKVKALVLLVGVASIGCATADTQAEITALQQQINALQTQANSKVIANNSALSQLDTTINRDVFSDYTEPFGFLPSVGLSYALMQEQHDFKSPLAFGGYLEADAQIWGGNNLNSGTTLSATYNQHGSNFAVTTANLYFLANPNSWTQAFLTLKGGLNGNSTTFSEAFLNFGDLSKLPLYATIGKTYIPFGVFSGSGPWSNTLVKSAFRSGEIPQMIFGFGKDGLNTSLSLYNGQTNVNDFAYSLQYGTNLGNFAYSVGAGYMNDVLYNQGALGSAYATGSTAVSATNPLSGSRNGAVDLNAQGSYNLGNNQSIALSGEWDTTTGTATAGGNPTGKMSAWDVAGTYTIPVFSKPTNFGLTYSETHNMQNVPLALSGSAITGPNATGIHSQWLVYASSEVLSDLFIGPEYSRQKMYNGAYTWAGTIDLSLYF